MDNIYSIKGQEKVVFENMEVYDLPKIIEMDNIYSMKGEEEPVFEKNIETYDLPYFSTTKIRLKNFELNRPEKKFDEANTRKSHCVVRNFKGIEPELENTVHRRCRSPGPVY
jgi:hypothetical protein